MHLMLEDVLAGGLPRTRPTPDSHNPPVRLPRRPPRRTPRGTPVEGEESDAERVYPPVFDWASVDVVAPDLSLGVAICDVELGSLQEPPTFRVDAIHDGGSACSRLVIEGRGFGELPPEFFPMNGDDLEASPWRVYLPQLDGFGGASLEPAALVSWTDTLVECVIPKGAICGPLILRVPAFALSFCGESVRVYRVQENDGILWFNFAPPDILQFRLTGDSSPAGAPRIAGDEDLLVMWSVDCAEEIEILLTSSSGGTFVDRSAESVGRLTIPQARLLPGGLPDSAIVISAEIRATNRCGTSRATTSLIVQRASVAIAGVELTQGVQVFRPGATRRAHEIHFAQLGVFGDVLGDIVELNPPLRFPPGEDNSIELIDGRPLLVRVYLRVEGRRARNIEVELRLRDEAGALVFVQVLVLRRQDPATPFRQLRWGADRNGERELPPSLADQAVTFRLVPRRLPPDGRLASWSRHRVEVRILAPAGSLDDIDETSTELVLASRPAPPLLVGYASLSFEGSDFATFSEIERLLVGASNYLPTGDLVTFPMVKPLLSFGSSPFSMDSRRALRVVRRASRNHDLPYGVAWVGILTSTLHARILSGAYGAAFNWGTVAWSINDAR